MQGFNMGRYVPPDVEGTISPNALHAKHRAATPPTVRFEMPFAAWCASCPRPTLIPQGVRFNAAKRRAGSYFSTPIWEFSFKHAQCGGRVVVQTDPKNTAYVITSGAARRAGDEEREREIYGLESRGAGDTSGTGNGGQGFLTDEERAQQRSSAFASLERTIEDRAALRAATARIDSLRGLSSRDWDDPYARNQALRRTFRAGRREREQRAREEDALRGRLGLGGDMAIMPEIEEDRRRAAVVEFGSGAGGTGAAGDAALARPLFAGVGKGGKTEGASKTEKRGKVEKRSTVEKSREGLVSELVSNTRALQDPFLQTRGDKTPRAVLGVKRKHTAPDPSTSQAASKTTNGPAQAPSPSPAPPPLVQTSTVSGGLVAYDSEDE